MGAGQQVTVKGAQPQCHEPGYTVFSHGDIHRDLLGFFKESI